LRRLQRCNNKMSQKLNINWKEVYDTEYIGLRKYAREIATKYKCGKTTVLRNFKKLGLITFTSGETKKGTRLSEEHKKKISDGEKGRKLSPEHCKIISERQKGKKLSKAHCKNISESQKGKRLSLKHRNKISKAMRGDKSPLWRGGRTLLAKTIRDCSEYRRWRLAIFERDKFTCGSCGGRGVYIEAHHTPQRFIDIIRKHGVTSILEALACQELWDVENGRTLCLNCHSKTKGYMSGPVDDSSILAGAKG